MLPTPFFADVTDTPSSLVGAVTAAFLGSMSLLAWVLRHVLSKTLPEQQAAHREQLADERKASQDQAAKERELAGQMYLGLLARIEASNDTARQARDASLTNQQAITRNGEAVVKSHESQERLARMIVRLLKRTGHADAAMPPGPPKV